MHDHLPVLVDAKAASIGLSLFALQLVHKFDQRFVRVVTRNINAIVLDVYPQLPGSIAGLVPERKARVLSRATRATLSGDPAPHMRSPRRARFCRQTSPCPKRMIPPTIIRSRFVRNCQPARRHRQSARPALSGPWLRSLGSSTTLSSRPVPRTGWSHSPGTGSDSSPL